MLEMRNLKMSMARYRGWKMLMRREMTAELTGWKHELVLLEGQESTEDGGKRLKTATVVAERAQLKQ